MLLGRRGGSFCDTMKCKGAHVEWAPKKELSGNTPGAANILN